MNANPTTWQGDWNSRVRQDVRAQGCETVNDFLRRYPSEPYHKVARRLPGNVAAVQLVLLQFQEAFQNGSIRNAARDCLAREICLNLKRGWGRGMRVDFHTAGAYASWVCSLEFRTGAPELRKVGEEVWKALVQKNPKEGWLPSGPDDPLIVAAFDQAWPELPPKTRISHRSLAFCPQCSAVLTPPGDTDREQVCPHCSYRITLT